MSEVNSSARGQGPTAADSDQADDRPQAPTAPSPSVHVARVLRAEAGSVYDYVRDVAHLPVWAAGVASHPAHVEGEELVVQTPGGAMRVHFIARNELGVLDHVLNMPDGRTLTTPMRALAHPAGCEVLVTIHREPGMSEADVEADRRAVAADLQTLAGILEA